VSDATIKKIIYLIRYGLTPEQAESLPLDVEAWLLPAQQAISLIEGEKARGS
jgi:hypothetical protein